jgi:hypothetical protein
LSLAYSPDSENAGSFMLISPLHMKSKWSDILPSSFQMLDFVKLLEKWNTVICVTLILKKCGNSMKKILRKY